MTQHDLDVIVAGHVCLDIIPGFPQGHNYEAGDVFCPGTIVDVRQATVATGGPVSNTGIPLAKLGLKIAFMARVGGDKFGRLTVDLLNQWADATGLSIREDEASSYTAVIAPPGVDRIFFHCPGTNHVFSASDVDYDLCRRARLFHLGYPPLMRRLFENDGQQLVEIYRRVKELGLTTSLDMALPDPQSEAGRVDWCRIFEKVLPYVDLFHPSAEEGLFMAQPDKWERLHRQAGNAELIDFLQAEDFSELAEKFIQWGAGMVTLKSGHRGFYFRSSGRDRLSSLGAATPASLEEWSSRELWMPAYKISHIASATGAGDCSLAGFIAAFLYGQSPERSIAAANALGYQNLQALDATSGIQDWETTRKIMEDQSLPRVSPLEGKGWRFDAGASICHGPGDKQ